MNLQALKTELTTDPIGRGYASMSDEQAAASFAIADRQPNRDSLDVGLLVASLVRAEYDILGALAKDYIKLLAVVGTLPLTSIVKAELSGMFPAGSQTRANLIALLKRTGNRAEELGFSRIPTPSDIADAKRLSQ